MNNFIKNDISLYLIINTLKFKHYGKRYQQGYFSRTLRT